MTAPTDVEVVVEWLRAKLAEAQAQPLERGRCRCGRATITSERAGRITTLGLLIEELTA